jgi:hypothetical protein
VGATSYALFSDSAAQSYFQGGVGIGVSNPGAQLDVTTSTVIYAGRFAQSGVAVNNTAIYGSSTGAGTNNFGGDFAASGSTTNYAIRGNASGAATNNYGAFLSCSGATNNYGLRINSPVASANNWAIYSDAAAQSYFAGKVGIAVVAPVYPLDVLGGGTSGVAGNFVQTGTAANSYGVYSSALGAATTNAAVYAIASGAANNFGVQSNVAIGANNYNIYASGTAQNYFNGDVVITGDGVFPALRADNVALIKGGISGVCLEVRSTTGAFLLPRMTTAQRDAGGGPTSNATNGMLIFNTTTVKYEAYNATLATWAAFASG